MQSAPSSLRAIEFIYLFYKYIISFDVLESELVTFLGQGYKLTYAIFSFFFPPDFIAFEELLLEF